MSKPLVTVRQAYASCLENLGVSDISAEVCAACGKTLSIKELGVADYTGLCEEHADHGPLLIDTMVSGAELWDCPPHCPSEDRTRQRFLMYPGCACDRGRAWDTITAGPLKGRSPRQCSTCQARHDSHPVIAEILRKGVRRESVLMHWQRRMTAELYTRCIKHGMLIKGNQISGDPEVYVQIHESIRKEGPCKPKGLGYARFPEGWAK